MKILRSRESGTVLFVVMMITGLIVAALGTYLTLASQEHKTLRRSFCWNAALPMAEAGIEEALSHINKDKTNFASDGVFRYFIDNDLSAREQKIDHCFFLSEILDEIRWYRNLYFLVSA